MVATKLMPDSCSGFRFKHFGPAVPKSVLPCCSQLTDVLGPSYVSCIRKDVDNPALSPASLEKWGRQTAALTKISF